MKKMFKNLKIGAKIVFGFGIVIVMMVIIATVILVTNLQSIYNVNAIDNNTSLQVLSVELLQDFLNARVPANKLIYTTDSAIYDDFKTTVSGIDGKFDEMYNLISKFPLLEKFKAPLENAETKVNEWISIVNLLGACNEEEVVYANEFLAYGPIVTEAMDAIMTGEINSVATASATGLRERSKKLDEANEISSLVTSFRIKARQIVFTYKTELLPDVLDEIEQVDLLVNDYKNNSDTQLQRDNADKLSEALVHYRNALVSFGEVCDKATDAAVNMPVVNQTAQSELNTALDAIDEAVTTRIKSTISSSQNTLFIIMAIVAIALLFAVVLAVVIMRGITKPVKAMHKIMNVVGETGSLKFTEDEKNELKINISKDEIGQSIELFAKMMNRFIVIAENLERIAKGDLTVTLSSLSTDDTMCNALIYMLDNLNDMFGSINEAAQQVNSGSDQVSGAAQALAQGATEQASSIEELSASIQEISSQVNENSDNAEKASLISDETSVEVKTGNEQMQQMLKAMDDINVSSNEISKIIMVIDNIASQTNILALNAAVEAARAGDAGKGFAVVAEEVRNLASKSADAAKQTNNLIASSIQSVRKGAEIAKKTAESLASIEVKAKEVNNYIIEIAGASKEQAQGISQINIGVEQISSVIQTNSATAEESAAAAEELSSQATLLTEQITHFKLR